MDNEEFKPKTAKLVVELEVTEEDVSCLLANAIAIPEGSAAWWGYDDEDYNEAKRQLIEERKPDSDSEICLEDVFARMLFNGKSLNLLDAGSDWWWKGHRNETLWAWQIRAEGLEPEGGEWHKVSLKDILDALPKYAEAHIYGDCGMDIRRINEDGDSLDADAIIQIAMFGEAIYG